MGVHLDLKISTGRLGWQIPAQLYIQRALNGLFKYFSTDHHKLAKFTEGRILLTPPKYFNDPWDFFVQRESLTDAQWRAQFEKFQSERESAVTFEEFKASVTAPEHLEQEGPHMQSGLSDIYGVVSLTSDPYNRLMWGYYADSHRGFVAEFAHGVVKESQGHQAVLTPFGLALKITYEPELPKFRPDASNALEVYFTKHRSWIHEDEWRVIEQLKKPASESHDGKTFYLLKFKPEYLVRIILGLRIAPQIELRLTEMANTPEFGHVKIDRMKIDVSGQLVCC